MTIGSQPLAQLHDIVAAPAAHWWPLAPIWYLVAALLIALVVLTATAIWRWQRRRRVRNAALRALRQPLPDINAITLVLKQDLFRLFSGQSHRCLNWTSLVFLFNRTVTGNSPTAAAPNPHPASAASLPAAPQQLCRVSATGPLLVTPCTATTEPSS